MMKKYWKMPLIAAGLALSVSPVNAQNPTAKDQPQERSAAQSKAAQSKGDKSGDKATSLIVLVPLAYGTDEQLGGGCWARLYTDDEFEGDMLSVVGPVDIANARVGGFHWGRRFESMVIGPKATVTAYDNENYKQRTATFKPNQRIPELSEKMGFFENIRSLRVSCAK